MQRRDLLKFLGSLPAARIGQCATAGLALGSTRLYAAPQTNARLLVVFMRGAYDASNLLVPIGSDFYYESRKTIAIPRPQGSGKSKADGKAVALPLDADWGLHPIMKDTLLPLYKEKQLAFVNFAGTDDLTRSHFDTQNTIELGQALKGQRDYGSGFLNRLVEVMGRNKAHPCAFSGQLPLIMRGKADVPNIALAAPKMAKPLKERQQKLIQRMYKDSTLGDMVREGFTVRNASADAIKKEMDEASGGAISAAGFKGEARRVATLMRDRFNVGFVDVGGWDTHVNQGGVEGALAKRLDILAQGLKGFAEGMGDQWKNTVVVVVSEFGRTFRENGNRGTDHGHGTTYWVMGGSVKGGQIAGEQTELTAKTLNQNRDYPVLNNYRDVLGGLFQRMYGLNAKQVQTVFPGAKAKDVGLV